VAKKKRTDIDLSSLPPDLPPRTPEQFQLALRRKTRLFYDVQRLRLQAEGRLTKKSPTNPIELHPVDLLKLQARVQDLESAERNALATLEEQLIEVPFYRDVIAPQRKEKYRGLGPRMASVILSSFDIEREDTVSKMWSFAGLRPVPCRRCTKCHEVCPEVVVGETYKHGKPAGNKCERAGCTVGTAETYDSGRQMRPTAGEKLPYNAWLRSKLCGVLGPVLLQVGSPYRSYYDNYKTRKVNANWGKNDAHRHQAATRYMVKMLLLDIWKDWRGYLNLPIRPSYQEEYLGHTHLSTQAAQLTPSVTTTRAADLATSTPHTRADSASSSEPGARAVQPTTSVLAARAVPPTPPAVQPRAVLRTPPALATRAVAATTPQLHTRAVTDSTPILHTRDEDDETAAELAAELAAQQLEA
jgi:ferredoxin